MAKSKEVAIIGAGVIGCSIGYHLARKGIKPIIIEKEAIGARASGKAWAVIVYPINMLAMAKTPSSFWAMPYGETIEKWQDLYLTGYYRLADLALDIWERGKIDIEFGVTPWTMVAVSEKAETRLKDNAAYLKEHEHCECNWISSGELRKIFPNISEKVRGGISFPQLQVEPYKYTLGLAQSAEALGAQIKSGNVVDFKKKGNRIVSAVLSSGTEIKADEFVIAAGPWSGQIASLLGYDIPLTIIMEECLRIKAPKGYPLHSLAGGVEILARVNGDIILATGEIQSVEHYFSSKARSDFDDSLSEDVKIKNIRAALEILPDLEQFKLIEHRGDLLAYGAEPYYHKPVMGRFPNWQNGYIATAFGGMGIHLSAGAGEVMADLIAEGHSPYRTQCLLEHLSPR
jgi:glycine oxidase